jgi:hypothetical protein
MPNQSKKAYEESDETAEMMKDVALSDEMDGDMLEPTGILEDL